MKLWNPMAFGTRRKVPGPSASPLAPAPFTLERDGEDTATLTLYGDIVSERPTDWEGTPIDGMFILLKDVLDRLEEVRDVSLLKVMIHSCGGNAFDSIAIHNRLKAMKARVEVTVDGVAMSGGSLIMCAGDLVQVYPSSLVMIHRCWGLFFGGYNAPELRKAAESYEAVDLSQAEIYREKTGLSQEELLALMDAETYMTGQQAVERGFADSVIQGTGTQVAASADRRTLFVGGLPVWVTDREGGLPCSLKLPTISTGTTPAEYKPSPSFPKAGAKSGGTKTMANNLEELRTENPQLADQLLAEARAFLASPGENAVQAERQRIQDIDALAALYDAETIREAKYGDHPCTAQEMAYQAAVKASQQGKSFLSDLMLDAKDSQASAVHAANPGAEPTGNLTPQQRMAQGRADAKALNPQKKEES